MVQLILLNGAPGSGKSTLAQRYVEDHPLALALDIDVVRGLLGRWLEQPAEAGVLARRMAIGMARVALSAGHDVIVPQFLGRPDFLLQLEQLSLELGVAFVEVVLICTADEARGRFLSRSLHLETPAQRDARALVERSGGINALAAMSDRLLEVVASRPRTIAVSTADGQVERAYRDLLGAISRTAGD